MSRRLAQLYGRATMLVLPSRSEGMGRVIIEAFCRGRPVVATAVGGIVDLVSSEHNGVLFPPEDEAALASAMVSVLGDRAYAALRWHLERRLLVGADRGGVRRQGSLSLSNWPLRRLRPVSTG